MIRQKKIKTEETPRIILAKKVDGQIAKKKRWNFEREDKSKTRKENRKGRKEAFQNRPFGGRKWKKKKKKNLQNCKKIIFGAFCKTKAQSAGNKKTKLQKKSKKHNLAFWQKKPPFFGKFVFFKLRSFMSAKQPKLCFAENTIKIVLSAEHNFCVSQIVKPPFEGKTQNGTFETKSAILGFPLCPLKPLFLWCWWFCMVTEESDISKNR